MTGEQQTTWELLAALIGARERRKLEAYLESLTPAETARAVSRLTDSARVSRR